jgi:hypothetical protein
MEQRIKVPAIANEFARDRPAARAVGLLHGHGVIEASAQRVSL